MIQAYFKATMFSPRHAGAVSKDTGNCCEAYPEPPPQQLRIVALDPQTEMLRQLRTARRIWRAALSLSRGKIAAAVLD